MTDLGLKAVQACALRGRETGGGWGQCKKVTINLFLSVRFNRNFH